MYLEREYTYAEDQAMTRHDTAMRDLQIGNAAVIDNLTDGEIDTLVNSVMAAHLDTDMDAEARKSAVICLLDKFVELAAENLTMERA